MLDEIALVLYKIDDNKAIFKVWPQYTKNTFENI